MTIYFSINTKMIPIYLLILNHSDTDSLLTYMYVNCKEQQYTCIYYPAFVRYTVCIVVCCIKKPCYFTFV